MSKSFCVSCDLSSRAIQSQNCSHERTSHHSVLFGGPKANYPLSGCVRAYCNGYGCCGSANLTAASCATWTDYYQRRDGPITNIRIPSQLLAATRSRGKGAQLFATFLAANGCKSALWEGCGHRQVVVRILLRSCSSSIPSSQLV